jgi:hypothetical protein
MVVVVHKFAHCGDHWGDRVDEEANVARKMRLPPAIRWHVDAIRPAINDLQVRAAKALSETLSTFHTKHCPQADEEDDAARPGRDATRDKERNKLSLLGKPPPAEVPKYTASKTWSVFAQASGTGSGTAQSCSASKCKFCQGAGSVRHGRAVEDIFECPAKPTPSDVQIRDLFERKDVAKIIRVHAHCMQFALVDPFEDDPWKIDDETRGVSDDIDAAAEVGVVAAGDGHGLDFTQHSAVEPEED